MELLSPAGSFLAMKAAVQNGADAVYLGGHRFNARISADNFNTEELRNALNYCHLRYVKVFVTLNTLISDREMSDALNYAGELYEMGVDAIIIQDLGLVSLIRKNIPGLELHASTQMGIHNLEGVRFCESMGISRAVLSREVSIPEMKYINDNCKIDTEVFVHGAMCMSFSGGCLFSSMVGGRSGNRGRCAQVCRKNASVNGRLDEHHLSMQDLCLIEHIDALKAAGVASLKIEGRMKKPEYVAAVTGAYRKAIDGANKRETLELKKELFEFFNRGEFTTGYCFGDGAKTNGVGSSKPSEALLKLAKESINAETKHIDADMRLKLAIGENAVLTMTAGGKCVSVDGEPAQPAKNAEVADTYARQLAKLGNTVFFARNIAIDMAEPAFLPVSAVNDMRRRTCEALESELCRRYADELTIDANALHVDAKKSHCGDAPIITAKVKTVKQAYAAAESGVNEIIYAPYDYRNIDFDGLCGLKRQGVVLYLALPDIMLKHEDCEHVKKLLEHELWDGAQINNAGELELCRDIKNITHLIGGAALNAFNAYTVNELMRCGVERAILSEELNRGQYLAIAKQLDVGNVMYGRTTLMRLCHCPVKEHSGCKNCSGEWQMLSDGECRHFPMSAVRLDNECAMMLYNCVVTDNIDKAESDMHCIVLNFTDETPDETANVIARLHNALRGARELPVGNFTRGHWNKGVE